MFNDLISSFNNLIDRSINTVMNNKGGLKDSLNYFFLGFKSNVRLVIFYGSLYYEY